MIIAVNRLFIIVFLKLQYKKTMESLTVYLIAFKYCAVLVKLIFGLLNNDLRCQALLKVPPEDGTFPHNPR